MTHWTPQWKLTVAGVDYTSKVIASISHFSGRTSIYQQPTASSLSIEIVDLNHLSYEFNVNDAVSLQVKDSSGSYVSIFGGRLTDIKTEVKKSSATTTMIHYTLIALGALSKLNRNLTDGVLSKANDGDQIYTILEPLLLNSWNEVPASETWATYDATETWANAQDIGLGEIDRPGDYELTSRSADPTDIYSLVSALATSGLGYIYEDSNGQICYADSTHRGQYLAANGFTELDANKAIGPGLQTTAKAADVRNSIKLIYKNNAYVTVEDATSIGTYGSLGSVVTTSLEKLADATTQANYYLTLRAYPQANLNQITFPISSGELTDSERDKLLGIFIGQPVIINNLPSAFGTTFTGFVEGWSFRTGFNSLLLTIYLSPIAYSTQAFKWSDVPITESWNTLTPTMDWLNATIVY